jgi:hypothetical protein
LPASRNWWTVASAVASGILVGFAASTIAYRLQLLRVPANGVVQRMDRDLHLTPAQKSRIVEVLDNTRAHIGELRDRFESQRQQALNDAFSQIRASLTPAQQHDFDRLYNPSGISPPKPPQQARQ